ncbi:hypothetical protein, partial [Roseibium aquae]
MFCEVFLGLCGFVYDHGCCGIGRIPFLGAAFCVLGEGLVDFVYLFLFSRVVHRVWIVWFGLDLFFLKLGVDRWFGWAYNP